ncbi:thiamin pyrophosphokinase [Phaffia rhodozyma]|uniref:Thiamine pyrophosphokinase n=1 Tax=Phaffia rhodozyma TaxID=264483 RepID=A0A0F7SSU8_PHARH|nr:thiamin pyrophosphokinase [Phaffia rhodozyma]
MPTIWNTSSFLSAASNSSTESSKALIVLNLPITKPEIFYRVWRSCQIRYCADGGANRLYDFFDSDKERRQFLPDLIKGDLDSLRSDVRSWYEQAGVRVVEDPDQYSTDLMKCISSIQAHEKAISANLDIILFGGLTGRLDQTIHTLHYLHKLRTERDKVWVVSDDEVAWCLDAGEHEIPIDHGILGPTCGILPLGVTDAVISTKGLRWDVENWETSFSTQISTSNQLVSTEPVVKITTNRPVWWNVAIQDLAVSK